jgi:outer membrane protein insertion porin family
MDKRPRPDADKKQGPESTARLTRKPVRARARVALLGAGIALLGWILCPCRSAARSPDEPSAVVREIRVVGTQRIEPDVVLLRLNTRTGEALDPAVLRSDIHSIMATGYFRTVTVEKEELPEGLRLIFTVEERPTIREIRYEGNKALELKDFEKVVTLKPNHFLNVAEVQENVEKIRKLYANEGYYRANISYETPAQENNQVSVVFKIQENKEVKIRRVLFLGNRAFPDKKLRKVVESKKKKFFSFLTGSGTYKEDVLRDDVTRLTLFYLDNGYLRFSAKPPETLIAQDGMYIVFLLEEGEQYKVRNVRYENVSQAEEERFRAQQKLREGDIFSREKLQQDILAMTDYYADQGYAFADVTPLYNPEDATRSVDISYQVKKGEKVSIGDIRIKGNTKTRDKVIRREMALAEGDLYSGSLIRKSKEEINRLGFFESVNVTTQPSEAPNRLDLVVDVKEGQTGTLSGGAGFSSTDQFIFMANITQSNLFGRAQVLSLNAEVGGTRQNFSLSFTEPWLFDIPLSAGFDIFKTQRIYEDFTRESVGGALRLGYEFLEHVRGNVMYKYEDVDISDVSRDAPITLRAEEGRSVTSSVTLSVVQDTLDNPLYPMRGFLNIASTEWAGSIFGGDSDFVKLQLDTGVYIPFYLNTTFHLRGRVGVGYGIGGDRLPVFERYFVGGISTVRGFDVRSLGPEVQGTVIGGNKQLIFNVEYIFPLVPQVKLRGLGFFDAGNAFSEDEDLRPQALRLSAGAGIQWFSPLGPLTFVLGFPLDRQEGEHSSAFQFSIGTAY